jgi:hypothetical protein
MMRKKTTLSMGFFALASRMLLLLLLLLLNAESSSALFALRGRGPIVHVLPVQFNVESPSPFARLAGEESTRLGSTDTFSNDLRRVLSPGFERTFAFATRAEATPRSGTLTVCGVGRRGTESHRSPAPLSFVTTLLP